MTDTLIADWSMYQSDYHGGPSLADKYNPLMWTVNIDFAAALAGVAGVIIRVGIGTRKDPCFDRYLAGIRPTGKPWGIYHAFDPSLDSLTQAGRAREWCPGSPPLGRWGDLEMGAPTFAQTEAYLLGLGADIYSGGPFLNTHYTAAQQAVLSLRRLWIAGYPNYWPPLGWNRGANHTLHQFTDHYQLPGMTHRSDMSRVNPASHWPAPAPPPTDSLAADIAAHARAIKGLAV